MVDQEQGMDELSLTNPEIIVMLIVMAFVFVVGYSIGFNSGKDEGYRAGYRRAKAIHAKRGE